MTLKELKIGQSARIKTVGGNGELRQHFLDMGVIPKAASNGGIIHGKGLFVSINQELC